MLHLVDILERIYRFSSLLFLLTVTELFSVLPLAVILAEHCEQFEFCIGPCSVLGFWISDTSPDNYVPAVNSL